MDLDHVAVATHDAREALRVLIGEWAGVDLWGGFGVGFRPMQVQLGADGMRLELLEPWDTERFDFLARFLARHGDGPHHITFKVKDLAAEIERLAGLGYNLVNINLADPHWKEAFFMPKDAHGTVVQVAQPSHTPEEMHAADPDGEFMERWWSPVPPRPDNVHVTLRRAVLASPDVPAAVAFFGDVLGGEQRDIGDGVVELTWEGGGRVHVEPRTDRAPGIDRIECESDGPTGDFTVAGATFRLLPTA